MTVKEVAESAERHRIRRLLALIRSIAVQVQIQPRDGEEAVLHLASRMGAIGRAALAPILAGTDLESLVLDELLVHRVHRPGIIVGGPAVRLNVKSAELLGLLIHEFSTNSIKFGALSQPQALLRVIWWFCSPGDSRLRLEWSEGDVRMPPVAARKPGFGSQLMKRLIARELHGEGDMRFLSDGILCAVEFPAAEVLLRDE